MKLTMLGTGNALVTECYNTCFLIHEGERVFMVDGGGGNTILRQLRQAGMDWRDMRDIFVTHKHVDHLMGILWMIRMICQHMAEGSYEGEARIYGHGEVIDLLRRMSEELYPQKHTCYLDTRLQLIPVEDGETREICGWPVTFFDIGSTKIRQFGFSMVLPSGGKLTCCGDEPYQSCEEQYAMGSEWMLHEAFCLHAQAERFHPYEKHHSTAKDAAVLAAQLGVKKLVLYHTEDANLARRKELYTVEAQRFFSGDVYVPDDLETIELS